MRTLFAVIAFALLAASSHAQCIGQNAPLAPMGFETITVSSTAIGFTAAQLHANGEDAVVAVVSIASNDIRYRDDGTAPTAAVGHPVASASQLTVCGADAMAKFKMIRQSSDATASVSYYKRAQ